MSEPYHVMTVCHGNICRSPIAEVVLRDRFETAGLGDRVVVDSRGISDEERGNPIDRRAQHVLRGHGYDVPARRATKVRADELDGRDLVLAMTRRHHRALAQLAGSSEVESRIRLYRSFDPGLSGAADPYELDMADPWYGDLDDFEQCLAQVEAAADDIVAFVADEIAARA
jgi:protein-tyrosine phosphatase